MNLRTSLLPGLLGLVLGLSACSTTPSTKPGSTNALAKAKPPGQAEAFARFAAGISRDLNAEPDAAEAEFERSASADPANEGLVLDLAQRFLKQRKPKSAVNVLAKSAARPEASARIFGLLGRAHLFAGATNDAIVASQKALVKDPLLMDAYQNLAEIHFRSGAVSNSLAVINRAASRTNADAAFLTSTADLYWEYLRIAPRETNVVHPLIRSTLKRALALDPESPIILARIADLSLAVHDQDQAAAIYEKLLVGLDDSPALRDAVRERLANFQLRKGDNERARIQLESIVRDNPARYPQVHYMLGLLAYEAKNYEKAATHFKTVILLNPNFEQAYYDLSGMLLSTKKPADAIRTLDDARKLFPRSFSVDYLTSMAYSQLKDPTNAVKYLVSAELLARTGETNRLTPGFLFQLGAAYERLKDFPKAEEYMLKALDLEPDSAETLNYLGYMWADRGEKLERAHTMIMKAVALEPDNGAYLDSLAWVLFKLGKPKEALTPMLRAIEAIEEPDATLQDHLGDIQFSLGDREAARKAWERALEIEPTDEIRKKLKGLTGS